MSKVEVSISVNGNSIGLLQNIDCEINSLDIVNSPQGCPKWINQNDKPVADWLYKLSQRADSISYNGILMNSADIDKWRTR